MYIVRYEIHTRPNPTGSVSHRQNPPNVRGSRTINYYIVLFRVAFSPRVSGGLHAHWFSDDALLFTDPNPVGNNRRYRRVYAVLALGVDVGVLQSTSTNFLKTVANPTNLIKYFRLLRIRAPGIHPRPSLYVQKVPSSGRETPFYGFILRPSYSIERGMTGTHISRAGQYIINYK